MNPEILGLIAGSLSCVTFLPQIFKTIRSKSVQDISVTSFSIVAVSTLLWLVYGFMLHSISIVLTNIVVFLSSLVMLYLKWKHQKG